MPMGHFPIPISDMGDGNWEMAHWHMVRAFVVLHNSVVSPRPPGADIEFLHATWRSVGIVEGLRVEDNAQFAQQLVEGGAAVGQAWKLDTVAIHVPHDGLFAIYDEFPQCTQ